MLSLLYHLRTNANDGRTHVGQQYNAQTLELSDSRHRTNLHDKSSDRCAGTGELIVTSISVVLIYSRQNTNKRKAAEELHNPSKKRRLLMETEVITDKPSLFMSVDISYKR
jgi:hypothetical protein